MDFSKFSILAVRGCVRGDEGFRGGGDGVRGDDGVCGDDGVRGNDGVC